MCLIFRYQHFYAKDVSTHPSMVSTQQHRFKGKMCKNVETVSTRVKSVSTRVAVFHKSVHLGRHTPRAGRHGTFFPEQHFPYFGQCVDTTTRAGRHTTGSFHLKVDGCHVSAQADGNQPRIVFPYT
ncbi:hypothetical protein Taro_046070, partial [Colocasia esculenta]|nr:hypothetical protein [Colocasia esculenta]